MMAIPNVRIEELLLERGYRLVHQTKKKRELQCGDAVPVYLNLTTTSGETALIIHPGLPVGDLTEGLEGISVREGYYHSSNMRKFPKRIHTGATPVSYGWGLTFATESSVQQLLARMEQGQPSSDLDAPIAIDTRANLNLAEIRQGAETLALAKLRIGQDYFREAMLIYWKVCAVTGLSAPELLRASHIKPWKDSTPEEKLDPFNGLLLAAHFDAAFDAGLISFDDTGMLLISKRLPESDRTLLGISAKTRLCKVDPSHLPYLAFHRSHIFRK
jgi:putative restriction endonuclease